MTPSLPTPPDQPLTRALLTAVLSGATRALVSWLLHH